MQGLIKPCRHRLSKSEYSQWRSHLCGLCLALRDHAGTASRMLTGYDVLLPSVLIEAQQGSLPTRTAGPCALRGGTTATVVRSDTSAAQFAVATATLVGAAGLEDKVEDRDLPGLMRPVARRAAVRLTTKGEALAQESGFDVAQIRDSAAAAIRSEAESTDLADLLAPSGQAVAAIFGHTAVVADVPENEPHLRRMGDAYGRLVHLIDAHQDRTADAKDGKFNPLAASGTDEEAAGALARRLASSIRTELGALSLAQPALVSKLLDSELRRAVDKQFGIRVHTSDGAQGCRDAVALPAAVAAIAATTTHQMAGFGGVKRRRRSREDRDSGSNFMCIPCCIPCDCCCLADCCCEGDC